MNCVKENKKKPLKASSFSNRKKGDTGPKASKKSQELKTKAIPASNANQESKNSEIQKSYLGKKSNPGEETNQEVKQPKNKKEPKTVYQKPTTYQQPMIYQDENNNINLGKNQWQKVNSGNKYKNLNLGAKSYQVSSQVHYAPKTYQFPRYYTKPRIYQPEEPFRKCHNGYNKVPEISVSELCRTLISLKVMEQAKTNYDAKNDQSNSSANNNEVKSQPNEPFFASNLEYYPHLPQVYYSQGYQTFNELKASVCQGNLTQMMPPPNNDYRFVKEWRKVFQTTEERQRALDAQRIGREQPKKEEKKEPSESKDFGQPPMEERQQNVGLHMPAQRGLEVQMSLQNLKKKQEQKATKPEQEKQKEPVLCCVKDQQELDECPRKEQRKQKEMEEQQQLLELEARIQRQKKSMEFVAQLQMAFEEEEKQEKQEKLEAEARRQEQARLRNERAKAAQRVARETRRYYEQLQYDFRFGPKELGDQGDDDAENVSKMPPSVLTGASAPLPSQLPQPMSSLFSGKTTAGNGKGIGN